MHMPIRHAALVSAITVSSWPADVAHAADAAAQAPASPPGQSQPALRPETPAPPVPRPVDLRPANLTFAASPLARQDDPRPGFAVDAASASARPATFAPGYSATAAAGPTLKLSRGPSAPRTGWEMSGRLGPLRWLTPLAGEGETQLRLGRRLENQPRMEGMPPINVGVHYSFE